MKKMIIGTLVFAVTLVALRRFGPKLGERAMKECEEMFDRMPEDFPPKQMLRGIEEIREQNTRILHHLDERRREPAVVPAG